jgi:ABC-type nitrate/sulfonate/bicarbonate transport system permease component
LAAWEAAVRLTGTPVYLLPPPSVVGQNLAANLGSLLAAGAVTLAEALAGLLLGGAFGLGLAVLLSRRAKAQAAAEARVLLEKVGLGRAVLLIFWAKRVRGILSLAMLLNATPLVAIAPILTIWLGIGPAPKIVVTALLIFFPVLINALTGFRAVDRAALEWFHSVDASPGEIFWHLRWPGARPYLFAALKVVGPLALVGAVVAEWMGASSGLGRVMWLAYANLNLPALFAAVFVLAAISIGLYQAILWLERRLIFWGDGST